MRLLILRKVFWSYYKQFQLINIPLAVFFALFTSGDSLDFYVHFLLVFFGLQLSGTKLFTIFILEHRYKGRYYLLNNLGISKVNLYASVFLINLIISFVCFLIYIATVN